MARRSTGRSIKSAERTLAVLEEFSKVQQPLSVGALSRSLDIPQPSMSMLLRNMADVGYLEYDRFARTYIPTIRVVLLGSWIERRFQETRSIGRALDLVFRRVGETAYIGFQNGANAQYIVAQGDQAPNALNIQSGQFRSLTCTAFGRALLALKPDRELIGWLTRCNAEATCAEHVIKRSDFEAIMRTVRAQGYCETNGDNIPGLGAIAMAFKSRVGARHLAVGVGGAVAQIDAKREKILDALREFCATIGGAE